MPRRSTAVRGLVIVIALVALIGTSLPLPVGVVAPPHGASDGIRSRGVPAGPSFRVEGVSPSLAGFSLPSSTSFSQFPSMLAGHLPEFLSGLSPSNLPDVPARSAGPPPGIGGVNQTLVLQNDSVLKGNFLPHNGYEPVASVWDPSDGDYYAADVGSDSVAVVNVSTFALIGNIPVGKDPFSLTYDSKNGYVYVANFDSNDVSVLSGTRLVATIPVGYYPTSDVYDPVSGYVYVTDLVTTGDLSGNVTVINGLSTITSITTVGYPWASTVFTATGNVYLSAWKALSGSRQGWVEQISGSAINGRVPVGNGPEGIAVDSNTDILYVSNAYSNNMTEVSGLYTGTLKVTTNFALGGNGTSCVYDAYNTDVYVALTNVGILDAINGQSVVGTVNFPYLYITPDGLSYDSTTDAVVFPSAVTDELVGVVGNQIVATGPTGSAPTFGGYDNQTNTDVVANWSTNALVEVNTTTHQVVGNISLGIAPAGAALDTANGNVYIANALSANVSVISGSNVLGSIPVGSLPESVLYDSANGGVYVANYLSGNISVIHGMSVTATINIGTPVSQLLLDKGVIYALAPAANETFEITSNAVAGHLATGWDPQALALDPASGDIYVSNYLSHNVTVLNGATHVGSVQVGDNSSAEYFDPIDGYVYVANEATNNVSILSGTSLLLSVPVGATPESMSLDPSNGVLYVADQGDANVSAINGTIGLGSFAVGMDPLLVGNQTTNQTVVITNLQSGTVSFYSPPRGPTSPVLSSVSVSPTSATPGVNQTDAFTAVPNCGTGPCPPGALFTWTLTNPSLGHLNISTGQMVNFTAGASPGTLALFVNATLATVTKMSAPVDITITSTAPAALTGVSVSPTTLSLAPGQNSSPVIASPVCGPSVCPAGTAYTWSLTNPSLGSLNVSVGPTVEFMAGSSAGSLALFVNATLNSVTRMSAPVSVTISSSTPLITAVTVSPSSDPSLAESTGAAFTASPVCGTQSCPGGTQFAWTRNNQSLGGSFNASSGSVVEFTAGTTPGSLDLQVIGTLDGVEAPPTEVPITITASAALQSVSIQVSGNALDPGTSVNLTAEPDCGGSSCGSGVTYHWTMTNDQYGALSSSSGATVRFTEDAGGAPSTTQVSIFVNASLGAVTKQGGPTTLTLHPAVLQLESVSVTPATANLTPDKNLVLTAQPYCQNATVCTVGAIYSWNLTSGSYGSLNVTDLQSVEFSAGSVTGTVVVFVNVTIGSVTRQSAPVTIVISHATSTPAPGSPLGIASSDYLWIAVGAAVVVAAILALVLLRSRKTPPAEAPAASPPWQEGAAAIKDEEWKEDE